MENVYKPNEAIVTTGRKEQPDSRRLAQETAGKLSLKFVPRNNLSLSDMREQYASPLILVAKERELFLVSEGGELHFHPGMAHLRLKNLRLGQNDNLVEAMGLEAGMSVLDCTLGLGSDAIVSSFIAGAKGRVTALESSPYIAAVIGYGLAHHSAENYPLQEAMRSIEVINRPYLDFLRQEADKSWDVVYFDPMFRHPLTDGSQLNPLRPVADHRPVPLEAIVEACRVAKRRVVLKENARSREFQRLGFSCIMGGRYSKVHYGVIKTGEFSPKEFFFPGQEYTEGRRINPINR